MKSDRGQRRATLAAALLAATGGTRAQDKTGDVLDLIDPLIGTTNGGLFVHVIHGLCLRLIVSAD